MEDKNRVTKKRKETLEKGLKQVALLEETETHILIDYEARKIRIYTNKATVMNRLERAGCTFKKQEIINGQVYSRSYEFDTKNIGKFLRTSIFKYDKI
ncbi:hypothetical protein SDC9_79016 [bioreactor metagenome]|uniref:Uncharacterized protein n=1 Tax=bioreactor metagenome TaxID=1076179 RepID=A0A644Z2S9_9ZZZZ